MTRESDAVPFGDIITDNDGSGHTSAPMTTRPRRIEVITGPDRRRRWSLEQKRAIVAESHRTDTTPSAVARRHGLNTGQLYTWRRQLKAVPLPNFARVELAELESSVAPLGLIEITLPDGARVRVDTKVDERALRRVLRVLRER
jgi:transposase